MVQLNMASNRLGALQTRSSDAYDNVQDEIDEEVLPHPELEKLLGLIRLAAYLSWVAHVHVEQYRNLNELTTLAVPALPAIVSTSIPS